MHLLDSSDPQAFLEDRFGLGSDLAVVPDLGSDLADLCFVPDLGSDPADLCFVLDLGSDPAGLCSVPDLDSDLADLGFVPCSYSFALLSLLEYDLKAFVISCHLDNTKDLLYK